MVLKSALHGESRFGDMRWFNGTEHKQSVIAAQMTDIEGRFVKPDKAHSSTSPGASIDVKLAASTKCSEMIETQKSFVSLMLAPVSERGE